jgi:hypothetical protein
MIRDQSTLLAVREQEFPYPGCKPAAARGADHF